MGIIGAVSDFGYGSARDDEKCKTDEVDGRKVCFWQRKNVVRRELIDFFAFLCFACPLSK